MTRFSSCPMPPAPTKPMIEEARTLISKRSIA
jgi:hypothetical protein